MGAAVLVALAGRHPLDRCPAPLPRRRRRRRPAGRRRGWPSTLWAMLEMRRRRANILPHPSGDRSGHHRSIRLEAGNPIYLANAVLLLGLGGLFDNAWFVVAAPFRRLRHGSPLRSGARNDTWRPSSGRTGSPMLAGRAAGSAVGPDRDHLKAGLSLARPVATKRSRKRRWETSQATALPREGASGADFYPHERRPRRQRAAGGRRQRLACVRVGACARRDAVRPVSSNGGGPSDTVLTTRLTLARRAGLWGRVTFGGEVVRFPGRSVQGPRSSVGVGEVNALELVQAYAKVRLGAGDARTLQLGRFTMDLGSKRFVSRQNFPQHHQRLYRRPFRQRPWPPGR